jgi:hypothetical protein
MPVYEVTTIEAWHHKVTYRVRAKNPAQAKERVLADKCEVLCIEHIEDRPTRESFVEWDGEPELVAKS